MNIWAYLYLACIYLSSLICLIAAYKIGRKDGWCAGIKEFFILVLFAVGYWLLESMAHVRAPFYIYPVDFGDMIPYFKWQLFGFTVAPGVMTHDCTIAGNVYAYNEISLSVPLLEMSMTYCIMWTARLLLEKNHGWSRPIKGLAGPTLTVTVAPFIVGLMALALDGYLDPIISESYRCRPLSLNHPGMGYWHWFAEDDLVNSWYGIPILNYAAWYAAPVILVTAVLLGSRILELLIYLYKKFTGQPATPPGFLTGLLQLAIFLAFLVLFYTSPGAKPPYLQMAVIVLAIIISLVIVTRLIGTYDRCNQFRWEFFVPQLMIFILPLLMFIFSGQFNLVQDWVLFLISLIFCAIGIVFALIPYSGWRILPGKCKPKTS